MINNTMGANTTAALNNTTILTQSGNAVQLPAGFRIVSAGGATANAANRGLAQYAIVPSNYYFLIMIIFYLIF